jgi:hypothetical protein
MFSTEERALNNNLTSYFYHVKGNSVFIIEVKRVLYPTRILICHFASPVLIKAMGLIQLISGLQPPGKM